MKKHSVSYSKPSLMPLALTNNNYDFAAMIPLQASKSIYDLHRIGIPDPRVHIADVEQDRALACRRQAGSRRRGGGADLPLARGALHVVLGHEDRRILHGGEGRCRLGRRLTIEAQRTQQHQGQIPKHRSLTAADRVTANAPSSLAPQGG